MSELHKLQQNKETEEPPHQVLQPGLLDDVLHVVADICFLFVNRHMM